MSGRSVAKFLAIALLLSIVGGAIAFVSMLATAVKIWGDPDALARHAINDFCEDMGLHLRVHWGNVLTPEMKAEWELGDALWWMRTRVLTPSELSRIQGDLERASATQTGAVGWWCRLATSSDPGWQAAVPPGSPSWWYTAAQGTGAKYLVGEAEGVEYAIVIEPTGNLSFMTTRTGLRR